MAPRVISGMAIFGVAAVAGLISYQHIEDLSLALHQTILVARLMPSRSSTRMRPGSRTLELELVDDAEDLLYIAAAVDELYFAVGVDGL